jgi:hypothetical protein
MGRRSRLECTSLKRRKSSVSSWRTHVPSAALALLWFVCRSIDLSFLKVSPNCIPFCEAWSMQGPIGGAGRTSRVNGRARHPLGSSSRQPMDGNQQSYASVYEGGPRVERKQQYKDLDPMQDDNHNVNDDSLNQSEALILSSLSNTETAMIAMQQAHRELATACQLHSIGYETTKCRSQEEEQEAISSPQRRRQARKQLSQKRLQRGQLKLLEAQVQDLSLNALLALTRTEALMTAFLTGVDTSANTGRDDDTSVPPSYSSERQKERIQIKTSQKLDQLMSSLEKELIMLMTTQKGETTTLYSTAAVQEVENVLSFARSLLNKLPKEDLGATQTLSANDAPNIKDKEDEDEPEGSIFAAFLEDEADKTSSRFTNVMMLVESTMSQALVANTTRTAPESSSSERSVMAFNEERTDTMFSQSAINEGDVIASSQPESVQLTTPQATDTPSPDSDKPKEKPQSIWAKLGIPSKRPVSERPRPLYEYVNGSGQISQRNLQFNSNMPLKKNKVTYWSGLIQDLHTAPTIVVSTTKSASSDISTTENNQKSSDAD